MEQLAIELVESQKTRSDLLKWKIIIVAALCVFGFGLSDNTAQLKYADLVLCAIPFVCAYVDVLCRHLSLRIGLIGRFNRLKWKDQGIDKITYHQEYEKFLDRIESKRILKLEDYAVIFSSTFFCLCLIFLPFALGGAADAPPLQHSEVIMASGVVGLIFVWMIQWRYWVLRKRIKDAGLGPNR